MSGLSQPVSDSAFMAQYGKPRNYGFNTAVGEGVAENRIAVLRDNIFRNQPTGDTTIFVKSEVVFQSSISMYKE